ncbi:nucleolar protein 14 [Galendromus occidentalis]|uniref:Nucleolar protein 14 n=1 Tax=Galendromus occidentalis TaxID=34638 RepID=A0AAJ6QSK8_9ACAR|nr:nucleolar protein 14 [Galendromus occidentalis]
MAKPKKKLNPDRVKVKPSREVHKNPFEVKVNKQKHQVINRKFKSERGLPGVARDRAISKRKLTLLKEYSQRHRDNQLVDRRIGEGDASMDPEERIALRLAQETSRKLNRKKNIFNLNEDEVLTHLGQTLDDVDPAYDDPRSDDEDIYDKLDAAFVKEAHFGGFLSKSQGGEEGRKRAIDDLIAESKRAKMERQLEVDQNVKLTQELDSKWRDLHSLLHHNEKTSAKAKGNSSQPDPFDRLVSELQYAPRAGVAMDKTKTQEELAAEERERLEELEKERRSRALGDVDSKKKLKIKHVSADDIDDNFAIGEDDGDCAEPDLAVDGGNSGDSDEEDDAGEEVEDDEERDAEEDSQQKDSGDSEGDSGEGGDSDEDSYDDLESDGPSEDEDEKKPKPSESVKPRTPRSILKSTITTKEIPTESITTDIPYLIAVPDHMDSFETLLDKRSPQDELLIIDRIIKGNAPSLHEQNRKRLEKFLQLLIDRVYMLADEPSIAQETLQRIDGLVPHIHHLVELSPQSAARSFVEVVKNIYHDGRANGPKKDSNFPGFEKLIMFKLIGICFSVSDSKHAVGSPALICMAHLLSTCKVTDARNMLRGIFLAQVMLEYVAFGSKYCPEVVAFILRVLSESHRLTVSGQIREKDLRLRISDLYRFVDQDIPRTDRCKILFGLLNLIESAADVFKELPSFPEIFGKIQQRLEKLETSWYPQSLKELLTSVTEKLNRVRTRGPLRREKKRPQMLKLYEPLIEERVDMLRKVHQDKGVKAETKKLQAKYRKELKGAMREVRRDNQFIAQFKLREQLKMDAERRRKVKMIFGDAANQQGELNSLKKLKAKKK